MLACGTLRTTWNALVLSYSTTGSGGDIEVCLCSDQGGSDPEDMYLELLEIYIQ